MLLIAVSESDAEKSAGAYGEQTLVRLPAACLKIKLGMQPRVDTLFHIICKKHYAERTGAGLYRNVPGDYDLRLFEAARDYFNV